MNLACLGCPTALRTVPVKALTVDDPVFLYQFVGCGVHRFVVAIRPIAGVLLSLVVALEVPVEFCVSELFTASTLVASEVQLVECGCQELRVRCCLEWLLTVGTRAVRIFSSPSSHAFETKLSGTVAAQPRSIDYFSANHAHETIFELFHSLFFLQLREAISWKFDSYILRLE